MIYPRRGWFGAVLALSLTAAPAAHAQMSGDGFLFRPPKGEITFHAGISHATAGSDIFEFITSELTVSRSDFSSRTLGGEAAFHITPRIAGLVSLSYARSGTGSEFRDWLDNNDLPIEQTTSFSRLPVTAGLKAYLTTPGRSVGRLAWIPRRFAVFVGGGAGVMRYELDQDGDFIDFGTLRVFRDMFASHGWRPTVHGFTGVDVSLSPRIALTIQIKYEHASGTLSTDFAGFDPIDLSGVSATTGISFRY